MEYQDQYFEGVKVLGQVFEVIGVIEVIEFERERLLALENLPILLNMVTIEYHRDLRLWIEDKAIVDTIQKIGIVVHRA